MNTVNSLQLNNLQNNDQQKLCSCCCLELHNIGVSIEKKDIIKNISFHIHCGNLIALVGPNGAGKTTLIKSIIGEIPHSGKIIFSHNHGELRQASQQKDLDKLAKTKKLIIGYTPQKLALERNNPITVLDFFLTKISKIPIFLFSNKKNIKMVKDILSIVKAEHLLNTSLSSLSGGELQRILLAYSLYPIPNVLLLDEPIAGIDVDGIELFYNIVSDLRKTFDLSIVLITHDIERIAPYADRFVFLNKVVQYDGNYQGLKQFLYGTHSEKVLATNMENKSVN